jgi:4-amino-4-deoxy-L-arabinose transferase-like glycosyltransferase
MKLIKNYWRGAAFASISLAAPLATSVASIHLSDPVLGLCCLLYFVGATYLAERIMQEARARVEDQHDLQSDSQQ